MLNLTINYKLILDNLISTSILFFFINKNAINKINLYLGKILLAIYWIQFINAYYIKNKKSNYNLYEDIITFDRNKSSLNDTKEIKFFDFFVLLCFFVFFSDIDIKIEVQYCSNAIVFSLVNESNDANASLSNI